MAGNCVGMVNDWYSPYLLQPVTEHLIRRDHPSGNAHVLRGGSLERQEFTIRASNRFSGNPSRLQIFILAHSSIGFGAHGAQHPHSSIAGILR